MKKSAVVKALGVFCYLCEQNQRINHHEEICSNLGRLRPQGRQRNQ